MNIKDKFRDFQTKYGALLAKSGIKLSGVDEVAKIEMIATAKLKDGTEVASPSAEFEVGAELFVIDADGNQTPAPDGDHTLEDGTIVTTAGGKITAITEIEVETEEDMSAEQVAQNLEELATKLSAVIAENESLKTELESLKAEKVTQSSQIETLKSDVAKLSKQAAAPSVKSVKQTAETQKKVEVPTSSKQTIRERVLQLAQQKSN